MNPSGGGLVQWTGLDVKTESLRGLLRRSPTGDGDVIAKSQLLVVYGHGLWFSADMRRVRVRPRRRGRRRWGYSLILVCIRGSLRKGEKGISLIDTDGHEVLQFGIHKRIHRSAPIDQIIYRWAWGKVACERSENKNGAR